MLRVFCNLCRHFSGLPPNPVSFMYGTWKLLRMSESRAPRPGAGGCSTVHGVGLYDLNRIIKARDVRVRA